MYFKVTLISKGQRLDHIVEAGNKYDAITKAKRGEPYSVAVEAKEVPAPLSEIFSKIGRDLSKMTKGKISIDQKISTIRQVAVMTDAGIAIHDTLEDVAENTENKRLKEIYNTLSADINAGKSMSDAMDKYTEEFGHVALAMTRLGENTGNFPASYHKLADILENIRDNVAKFKKAIRYPLITLTAMAIAFTVLIMVVVPKFRDIFEKLNTELPVPTKILLSIEYGFSHYGIVILLTLITLVYTLIFMYKNNRDFKY
jgi:general secretion pathway protein F